MRDQGRLLWFLRIEDRLEIRQDDGFRAGEGNCSEAGPILADKEKCLIFKKVRNEEVMSDIRERVRGEGNETLHTAYCNLHATSRGGLVHRPRNV